MLTQTIFLSVFYKLILNLIY